jgi:hypothetical protein
MDYLSKATRIVEVLDAVASGVTLLAAFAEEDSEGSRVHDAIAHGYLVPDGNGTLQLSERGKEVMCGKDPCGCIYTRLSVQALAKALGREDEFIEFSV